jgi:hypothetical protein
VSDEQQQKLSRRAQRREALGTDEQRPEQGPDAAEAPDEGVAEGSATETIREENRRSRRAAAAKRRNKLERERALDVGLDAGEMVDDAVARGTDAAAKWVKRHFNALQWIIVIGVGGWIGYEIYTWRQNKAEARSTDALMLAVSAERGKIGSPGDEGKSDVRGYTDGRRVFATADARHAAAKEAYSKAESMRPGKPIDTLADLGLAGLAYDEGKHADARKLYEAVENSELAKKDPDVRGRAMEGTALTLEAEGKTDAAIKRYKELESAELMGFTLLARYGQARLLHAKGDDVSAKELLKKVVDATSKKEKADEPPAYTEQAARDLLESIDPEALGGEMGSVAKDALDKALQQLQLTAPPAPAPSQGP